MSKVICFGGPPCITHQPMRVQGPDGKPQMAIAELLQRPSIPRTERACSLWAAKDLTEVANDVQKPEGLVAQPTHPAENV